MKKIAVSIRNRVFSEGILLMLRQTGDFRPIRIPSQSPELARDVMRVKQAQQIDAFFYASVTAQYLVAALDAL